MERRALSLLSALLLCCACHAPEKADAFIADDAGWSQRGGWGTTALYLPNRLIDLCDIVHLGYGLGPGIGLGLHFTRYGRLVGTTAVDVGIAWLGRFVRPTQVGVYAFAAAGPAEALAGSKVDHLWHIPKWDIGVSVHLLDHVYVGIAPDEIVDFFAGWTTFDTKRDDW